MFRWIKNTIFMADELTMWEFLKVFLVAIIAAPFFYFFMIALHAIGYAVTGVR